MKLEKEKVTKEGYQKILDEIKDREEVVRVKIADEIERARQQGDLSENAAYKSAIESKEFNENRISQLKEQLASSEIIEQASKTSVVMGVEVEIEKKDDKKRIKYKVVGNNESDPSNNMISIDSPIGVAMSGKKVGDNFIVKSPAGETEFIIKSIN